MCSKFKRMECFSCGETIDFPVEIEDGFEEVSFVFGRPFGCSKCRVRLIFNREFKMIFRDYRYQVNPQLVHSLTLSMSCPGKNCKGEVDLLFAKAFDEIPKKFRTKQEADAFREKRGRDLVWVSYGQIQEQFLSLTAPCSECSRRWEVSSSYGQSLAFQTERPEREDWQNGNLHYPQGGVK